MSEEKKTGAERTQKAVRDEFWTDERVRSFLTMQAPEGTPGDYHILLRAYRGMLPDTFARFVEFFVSEGHDINARLSNNTTILDHILQHRKSAAYAQVLEAAGAQSSTPRRSATP